MIDENEFFRQATLRICGNLEIEFAMQECLLYLRAFMPADRLQLNLYDKGLGALRTIAIATPTEASRLNMVLLPLDDAAKKFLDDPGLPPVMIQNRVLMDPVAGPIAQRDGRWNDSIMVMHLAVKETKLGNLVLFAQGVDRYSDEHLQLFTILYEPFAIALSNALRYNELNQLKEVMADDLRYLQGRLQHFSGNVIGEEFGLKEVMEMVMEVAPLDSPVLLRGETGVGKEIIANAIHSLSRRKNGPFIQVNCGAIPETLIDSELFGHEKGAFTGAISQKRGCFERADGGTIFLDEVGELPLQAQVRMLRVLQDKTILRVGGTNQIKVDIRIIAATHQNLHEMVKRRLFRDDLWFRLNVFPIFIPPLRDRKEDIPALVDHFVEKKSKELQMHLLPRLALGAMAPLMAYAWPGNVRELENVIERALILSKGRPLTFDNILWPDDNMEHEESTTQKDGFLDFDRAMSKHIKHALEIAKGRIYGPFGAARLLGLNPSTLRHRMRKLGIVHRSRK
jgi:transcriptional regulator with GAF, ATPase, and Fis domain